MEEFVEKATSYSLHLCLNATLIRLKANDHSVELFSPFRE